MVDQAQRPRLELVATASCSRCDEALDWLLSMPELRGLALSTLEVMAEDALYANYADRVPVLRVGDEELDWPFDLAKIRRLIGA